MGESPDRMERSFQLSRSELVVRTPVSAHLGVTIMAASRTLSRNKCFSMVEVLIAIAIVGMLAALVAVPMTSHVRGAEVDGAAARIQSALSDAQATARESGLPVTVIAIVGDDGRTGVDSRTVSETASQAANANLGMEHAFTRATKRLNLPQGITIAGRTPAAEPVRSLGGMGAPASDSRPEVSEPRERTLAVFLPDGSAVVSGPILVRGRDGRSSEVRVNPWTGVAALAGATTDDPRRTDTLDTRAGGLHDELDPFAKWR